MRASEFCFCLLVAWGGVRTLLREVQEAAGQPSSVLPPTVPQRERREEEERIPTVFFPALSQYLPDVVGQGVDPVVCAELVIARWIPILFGGAGEALASSTSASRSESGTYVHPPSSST